MSGPLGDDDFVEVTRRNSTCLTKNYYFRPSRKGKRWIGLTPQRDRQENWIVISPRDGSGFLISSSMENLVATQIKTKKKKNSLTGGPCRLIDNSKYVRKSNQTLPLPSIENYYATEFLSLWNKGERNTSPNSLRSFLIHFNSMYKDNQPREKVKYFCLFLFTTRRRTFVDVDEGDEERAARNGHGPAPRNVVVR